MLKVWMHDREIFDIDKDKILRVLGDNGMLKLARYIEHQSGLNEYPEGSIEAKMFDEQCWINFPILYLSSIYLHEYAKEKGCTKFLFLTRDCCHWYRIFEKLFSENISYFHASRNMLEKALKGDCAYDEYVQKEIGDDKCIFIDIHGTGKRILDYFVNKNLDIPHYFILTVTQKKFSDLPAITKKYSHRVLTCYYDYRGSPIEMLNYDLVGTLQDFDSTGPIRDRLEYSKKDVEIYHRTMDLMIKDMPVKISSINQLKYQLKQLLKPIQNKNPIIAQKITHLAKHPKHFKSKSKSKSKSNQFILQDLISSESVYSLVWSVQYQGHICALKTVILDSGCHRLKNKYYLGSKSISLAQAEKYFEKLDVPWNNRLYLDKKGLSEHKFQQEVENLKKLANLNLVPKIYDFGIYKNGNVHFGYIIMDKLDTTVKKILLNRNLTATEDKKISKLITKLHSNSYLHHDLKPSNIGVYLENDEIKSCLFLDCQKVEFLPENDHDLNSGIQIDLTHYQKHVKKNIKER